MASQHHNELNNRFYLVYSEHSGEIIIDIFTFHRTGRMVHICFIKLSIIVSDNGLSPGRHLAIIWTNAGMLLIWTLGTNFTEILSKTQ